MNLLHRYLLRELIIATLVGVSLFAFVLLIGSLIKDVVTPVANGQLSLLRAGELMIGLLPFVLTYALPTGLLTGVLLTLGRISAQHEITAMRTAGLGLLRIGAPVLFLAMSGLVVSLVVNFSYAPAARTQYRRVLFEIAQTDPLSLIVPRTFVREFRDVIVYVGERDDTLLRDIWVWKSDEQHRVTSFSWAREGNLRWNEEHNTLELTVRGVVSHLRTGDDPEDFSGGQGFPAGDPDPEHPIELPLDRVFKRSTFTKKISWMNFQELVSELHRLAGTAEPAERDRLLEVRMNLHEKAALGFSVFSFALVGVPLGIRTRRKETSANLGVALLLTLVFYLLMMAARWLDDRPDLHPELLLWVPNIFFQALGGWMWWRFGKN